jgi:hypothetical protein
LCGYIIEHDRAHFILLREMLRQRQPEE